MLSCKDLFSYKLYLCFQVNTEQRKMNLSGLITRLINTMAILLVALTQNAVLSKPTNFHNDPSVSAVDASSEKLSMDYYKTTTPKNTKLHSRDISLGALLSKSVLQEQQQPEIIKRYRRVCKYLISNVNGVLD